MKFENAEAYNLDHAIAGMRNPMMSHGKSDSIWHEWMNGSGVQRRFEIGPNDYQLAKTLITAGEPHRKFLRQIFVNVDILKMPAYMLHEFATYKVGTTLDCSSTMHKITSRPLTGDDFEKPRTEIETIQLGDTIQALNICRETYLELKASSDDKKAEDFFLSMKRMLPHSYLYERMSWTANYEVLSNIWYWRHNHLLPCWHEFCEEFVEKLPYSEFITRQFDR